MMLLALVCLKMRTGLTGEEICIH